jgi:hypothetical protein
VVLADVTVSDGQVELKQDDKTVTLPQEAVRQIAWHAESQPEYDQRAAALQNDDLDGHFALAEWAQEQLRYELAVQECDFVLQRDPRHPNARVLRDFVRIQIVEDIESLRHLESAKPAPSAPETPTIARPRASSGGSAKLMPLLEAPMIQRLRRAELLNDPPEKVRIVLKNKVDARFAADQEGTHVLPNDRAKRRFLRSSPVDKYYLILESGRLDEYAADILIESDPEVFLEFRRFAWPIINRSCAVSGCHVGPNSEVFQLRDSQPLSEAELYTNFLTLDEQTVTRPRGDQEFEYRLIDRDQPDESLLLHYLLPPRDVDAEFRHSDDLAVKHGFRSRDDRDYARLRDWIQLLKFPHPIYQPGESD